MDFSFDRLSKVVMQEKRAAALVVLESDFYAQCASWMNGEEEKVAKDFSFESARNVENAKRLLKELVERRRHKVVLRLLNSSGAIEGLAKEEQSFADSMRALFANFDSALSQGRTPKALSSQEAGVIAPDSRSIKFVQALPEFVAPNGSPYGPFQAHEKTQLPTTVAEFLVKRGAAVFE